MPYAGVENKSPGPPSFQKVPLRPRPLYVRSIINDPPLRPLHTSLLNLPASTRPTQPFPSPPRRMLTHTYPQRVYTRPLPAAPSSLALPFSAVPA